MKTRFSSSANQDFMQAIRYYRDISPRLGQRFKQGVETALTRIGSYPYMWRVAWQNVRRCMVRPKLSDNVRRIAPTS